MGDIEYWIFFVTENWIEFQNSVFNDIFDFRVKFKKIYHFLFQISFNWANNLIWFDLISKSEWWASLWAFVVALLQGTFFWENNHLFIDVLKGIHRFVRHISVWEQLFPHIWTILAVSEKVVLINVRTLVRCLQQMPNHKTEGEKRNRYVPFYNFMLL